MVGSDAIPESSNNNHPRGAGCFSRLLGPYVRDMGILSLMDALAKCTILPAKRLDTRVPMLARKGRMQMDADADIYDFRSDDNRRYFNGREARADVSGNFLRIRFRCHCERSGRREA